MTDFYLALSTFLLLNVLVSLIRILRGPTRGDRMLTAQLFGTSGTAILLLLAQVFHEAALTNAALVFAILSAVAALSFVQLGSQRENGGHDGN